MNIRIIPFNNCYLEEMALLFVEVYSEKGAEWNIEKAKEYLEKDYKNYPEYCFIALDENGECVGGIFCRVDPYYKGDYLFVDTIQVKEKFRGKGVAKLLFKKVIRVAKEKRIQGVHLLADQRKNFPRNWYHRIGFEPSGWIEYEVKSNDLKL